MKENCDDQLLSQTISFLRFPLVVLVVFLHHNVSQGLILGGAKVVNGANGLLAFIITLISDVLSNVGVPLFFLFSGFLFFYKGDFSYALYKSKIKKRVKTLLLPFIVWNIVALSFSLCRFVPPLSQLIPNIEELSIKWSLSGFLNSFWNMDSGIVSHVHLQGDAIYPIDQPLWYVRDLMIVILCSPLIYYLIKLFKYYWVCILGIMWLLIEPIKLGHLNQLITSLFFFSWGASYSIQRANFVMRFRKFTFLPFVYIIVAITDALTKHYGYHVYIHDLGILIGIVSFVYVASLLIEKRIAKPNAFLAGSCFFIYAGHDIILNNVSKLIIRIWHVDSQWYLLANYVLVPFIIIVLFLGLYAFIKKYIPKLLIPLTGGR